MDLKELSQSEHDNSMGGGERGGGRYEGRVSNALKEGRK